MAGLLEKLESYPKTNRVYLEGEEGDNTEVIEQQAEDTEHEQNIDDKKDNKSPDDEQKESKSAEEDKEPAKNAPKAEKDAYKERKLKAADAEKKAEKDRADRLERELEAAKKREDDWKEQARLAAQRPVTQPAPQPQTQTEKTKPDISKDPVAYFEQEIKEIKQNQQILDRQNVEKSASGELADMERSYAEKVTDYHDVMKHAEDTEVKKVMMMNPRANEAAVRAAFKSDKLKVAVTFLSQGKDPVEGLYNLSKVSYGYQPKAASTVETTAEDKSAAEKAKFASVQKNKAKSGTGLGAGGAGKSSDGIGTARTNPLPLREIAKMTKEQKNAYYSDQ